MWFSSNKSVLLHSIYDLVTESYSRHKKRASHIDLPFWITSGVRCKSKKHPSVIGSTKPIVPPTHYEHQTLSKVFSFRGFRKKALISNHFLQFETFYLQKRFLTSRFKGPRGAAPQFPRFARRPLSSSVRKLIGLREIEILLVQKTRLCWSLSWWQSLSCIKPKH